MRILLTNDDGFQATGLAVLKRIADKLSDDVWICAPDTEQSAASRGVSLHSPVRLRKHDKKVYSVTGTPTDSVIVAMSDCLRMKKNPTLFFPASIAARTSPKT